MTDEFQAGICAENWWMNPSQSNFGSSVCSPIINNMDLISWPADLDIKARASDDQSGSANSEGSIVFEDSRRPMDQDGSLLALNSNLEMINKNLSSSITANWNPTLLDHDNKSNGYNYQTNLLDSLNSSSNYQQDAGNLSHIKKDWSPEKFSTFNKISSLESYKGQPADQVFSVSSSSYGYTSSLMQTLFHTDSDQDSVFGNQPMEYAALSNICPEKLNEFTSSNNSLLKPSPVVLPKQPLNHLNLPNNSAWNTSNDSQFASGQSQFFSPKFADELNCPSLSVKSDNKRNRDMSTAVKINSTEPVFKRQRMQTPSPLPTFKVRKEKLGDRVTALQQLVSPFGKTDTASVLHEAIEYIKLLHDQVTVLITPYIKGGSPIPHDHEQTRRDPKGRRQELRSRGLCLVPISSTFPVASETTADFWTPTFGGSFR